MTYSVLICDDTPEVGVNFVEQVRAVAPKDHYSVLEAPSKEEVQCAVKELFARQSDLLGPRERGRSACLFDEADILILDYDLLRIDEENARHTGESLARLARLLSDADVIVVYNQFQGAHFDLSLRGHLSSHADLNVEADLLSARGLWTDPPWYGFRPWHWQTLHRAVETQRARQRLVAEHFNEAIVDVLGMREEDLLCLSDTAVGFIAPDAHDWEDTQVHTFKSFAESIGNGKCTSDLLKLDKEAAYRFAASRIGKWLERQVLGPQDVLVDLPHLVQFFPFLLEDDMDELEAWNATAFEPESLKGKVPAGCWFEAGGFLSRPAVWRQRFEADNAVRESWGALDYSSGRPFVFLEDTSSFAPFDDARQFRAGHHNAFDWRFIKHLNGITYSPQRRLAYAE